MHNERGLSYPDITSLSQLAKVLDVETSELLDLCQKENSKTEKVNLREIINLCCKAISLAMGVSVVVLSILNELEVSNAIMMLGIGLSCVSILFFQKEDKRD